MAADEKTKFLKEQLGSYLQAKGINIKKEFHCLNPGHEDKHPSMKYYPKLNIVKCFSCSVTYDLFDLIGIDYGITDFKDQKKQAEILFPTGFISKQTINIPKKKELNPAGGNMDTKKYIEDCHKAVKQTDYFKVRGITEDTVEKFNLGYDQSRDAVIIPCSDDYYITRPINSDDKDAKYINLKGKNIQLFNPGALDQTEPVFITEGCFDALSILQTGFQALAINSTSNIGILLNELKKRELNRLPYLILYLDNDNSGIKAQETLSAELKGLNIAFSEVKIANRNKDANSDLLAFKSDFRGILKENIDQIPNEMAEYEKNNLIYHLLRFTSIPMAEDYFPSGFKNLDEKLDGGFYEGLIVLGSQSGIGKTTLALQIANQISEQKKPVLFFSLEQSIRELAIKTISMYSGDRLSFAEVRALMNNRDGRFTVNNPQQAYDEALEKVQTVNQKLYIKEADRTIEAIRKAINYHVLLLGENPFVIIDYLQMIKPSQDRVKNSDKQNVDYHITELKQISKQYHLPIMIISSLNRSSYDTDITEEAFKESGGIEYTSDYLLGLQFRAVLNKSSDFNSDREKEKNPREVQLKIIKNRSGEAGGRINLDFDARYNRFKEV